jgi:hypothetical protein
MWYVHQKFIKLKTMKTEKDLAEELGIDRNVLRAWRMDGTIATSSTVKMGNKIVYHEEGEEEVREKLKNEISVSEISEPLDTTQPQELEITQIPLNPKLVICGEIYVRVSSNKNFLKGMKVKARPPATEGRVWVMLGRTPRWRGRW